VCRCCASAPLNCLCLLPLPAAALQLQAAQDAVTAARALRDQEGSQVRGMRVQGMRVRGVRKSLRTRFLSNCVSVITFRMVRTIVGPHRLAAVCGCCGAVAAQHTAHAVHVVHACTPGRQERRGGPRTGTRTPRLPAR
jgi:hypothetical protein